MRGRQTGFVTDTMTSESGTRPPTRRTRSQDRKTRTHAPSLFMCPVFVHRPGPQPVSCGEGWRYVGRSTPPPRSALAKHDLKAKTNSAAAAHSWSSHAPCAKVQLEPLAQGPLNQCKQRFLGRQQPGKRDAGSPRGSFAGHEFGGSHFFVRRPRTKRFAEPPFSDTKKLAANQVSWLSCRAPKMVGINENELFFVRETQHVTPLLQSFADC